MSTYRNLLLSTGGGVIGNRQLDEQNDSATIAIGLGGTGVACLRNLKSQVYARLQPDDPQATVPTYQHIKFLAVDTDRNSLSADGRINSLDEATEFFDISAANINALIAETETIAIRPEFNWLRTTKRNPDLSIKERGLEILSAAAGAGGVRQIGRLLLVQKANTFVSRIEHLITDAKSGLPGNSPVNIHIFTGMGGGTGSGTFLDVCYLVRQALRNTGDGGSALTCGYFFMPDVNLSVPQVAANPAISKYIKANGFAAMKELDYCMNFENNGGVWDQQYPGFHIGPIGEPPVNICHVISAATTKGAALENGFSYAMNVVSDFIMQFIVKNDITMESHIANYSRAIGGVGRQHGGNYTYCLLGASNAVVPMKEITTYLASKLFEEMASIGEKQPTDGEIAEIAKNNGLTYQQLQREILQGTSCQMPMVELDYHLFGNMSEEDLGMQGKFKLPETIGLPFEKIQEQMINKIEANMQALTQNWSWKSIEHGDDTSVSKVCKIYYSLASVVSNPECGPEYAANVLNGIGRRNLVVLLRGVQAQAQEEFNNCNNNMGLRCEELKQARTRFLHPRMIDNKRRLFEEFMARVQRWYSDDSKLKMLEKLESMLRVMITQFERLHTECFDIYAKVAKNLVETFDENYRTLTNAQATNAVADPFVIPLMTIADMRESLDATVDAMRLDDEMTAFHSTLFKNYEAWNSGDEKKISKAVSSYLILKFSGYTEKTLTDYLKIRFATDDTGELTNKVYQEILRPLSDKATPLFWKEPAYQIGTSSLLGYCSVPDNSAAIRAAAVKMISDSENQSLQQINSKLADRIFLLRCACGVPLFAYNGIENYSLVYNADRGKGKHLYEKTERNERDWNNLFNLIPYSKMQEKTEKMKEDSLLYDHAVEKNIVRQRPDVPEEYQVVVMPSIEVLIDEMKAAIESKDADRIVAAEKKLEAFTASMESERLISIPNDGMQGYEASVRKDHFLASSELIKLIAEELEKKKALKEIKEEIKIAKDEVVIHRKVKQVYFDALMTGVIKCQGRIKVVYEKTDDFGFTEEVLLSNPSIKPYGSLAPIYQGFQTFRELEKDVCIAAEDVSDQRKNNVAPEIAEACSQLKTLFVPEYLQMIQSGCRQQVPEKETEIVGFVKEFLVALKNFCMMYGV